MDVAALSLNIDSTPVVKATNDLERFALASSKAEAASIKAVAANNNHSGSIAKLVATVQSVDAKLSVIVGSLEKLASANRAVAASNDNTAASAAKVGVAVAAADAHVIAYTQHLAGLVAAQSGANIAMQQADAHVIAYRANLDALAIAAPKASQGVLQLSRSMIVADQNAGGLKANTGNIAAQFQDIGVTAAMGMNPLLIALQQGTQLSAVFAQSGASLGATLRAAFTQVFSVAALMTIGIVAAVAAIIQLGMSFLSAGDKADKLADKFASVKWATDAMGKAQTILGGYMDITTGKIIHQSAALRDLALAQAMVAKVEAQINQERARSAMSKMAQERIQVSAGPMGFSVGTGYRPESGIVDSFMKGQMSAKTALTQLERLKDLGHLTRDSFLAAASAIANFNVETENIKKFDELGKAITGDTGALQQFLDPKKTGKSEAQKLAERLADILAAARAEVEAETRRAEAVRISARAAAEAEQRAKLFNQAQQAGIPITAGLSAEIDKLAKSYADAKIAADIAEVMKSATDAMIQQRQVIKDEIALIGLRGEALHRARMEQEALNAARAALPRGEGLPADAEAAIKAGAASNAQLAQQLAHDRFWQEQIDKADEMTAALDRERGSIGLTGEAAIQYAYVTERLLEAKRQHIELSSSEVAAIEAAGAAYAAQRYQIDQQKQALADSREIAKGFFSDWINGVRDGGNLFKTFADSVVNSLNRIIDKLLDRTLEGFLDNMFAGGGGILGSILGGGFSAGRLAADTQGSLDRIGSSLVAPNNMSPWEVINAPVKYAKGGTFTNSIVNTPTLFRFAKGAKIGEMGEDGPEGVFPLKRGPNGELGVAAHGGSGKPVIQMGDVHNSYSFAGAVGLDGIVSLVRQGGEQTYNQIKRDLQSLLEQLDRDGSFAT